MPRKYITKDRLLELLDYDPETGLFRWRIKRGRQAAGNIAGRPSAGYTQLQIDKVLYQAHWVAWFYVYGEWPTEEVDHKNGVKTDNRISNLRLATRLQQRQNHGISVKNTSGCIGVSFNQRCKKWHVKIYKNKKMHWGGAWDMYEDAVEAYLALRAKLYEFQPVPRGTIASGQMA